MPKSQIIYDVVNENITLVQALRQLQVLSHDVGNIELESWAEKELTGYKPDDNLPDYRRTKSLNFVYSGINNYTIQANRVPLSISFLSTETLEKISSIEIRENIESVREFCEGKTPVQIDRSFLAQEIEKRSEGGLQCYSVAQLVPTSFFKSIEAEVRNKTTKALMMLEDAYGSLDGLGISDVSKMKASVQNERINSVVLNIDSGSNRETATNKIAWNVVVPIATAVAGAVLGALAISFLGI